MLSIAQKIHFADTANTWHVVYVRDPLPTEAHACVGLLKLGPDTLINGKKYKPISGPVKSISLSSPGQGPACPSMGGFFREDTLENKVWFLRPDLADTVETLIYSHNWSIGDTIHWRALIDSFNQPRYQGRSTVVGMDSSNIQGIWYRVFHMSSRDGTGSLLANYDITEGLGSMSGPNFPAHGYTFEDAWYLCAFYRAGAPVYGNPHTCNSVLVNQVHVSAAKVDVFPNPVNSLSRLRFPESITASTLLLRDATGRAIASISITGKHDIAIGQYLTSPGIYTYVLQDASTGQRYTGRFLFQ